MFIVFQTSFQVKRRRRREGKTDYQHRFNMLRQDELKSRLVVRFTNTKCIVAIVKAYLTGDRIVAYAHSTELKKYGVDFGLNSTFAHTPQDSSALTENGLDEIYQAKTEVGEYAVKDVEDVEDEAKAYKVFLDIGLARSSKGAKMFIAMKSASDAGLQIPHSEVKFFGYTEEKGLDAKLLRDLRKRINQ